MAVEPTPESTPDPTPDPAPESAPEAAAPEASAPEAAAPEAAKKPLLPPSRIVLLVLLAAAIVVGVLEFGARLNCNATFNAINEAMEGADQRGTLLKREELNKLVRGAPERDKQRRKETLTWKGVLRSYQLEVQYGAFDAVRGVRSPEPVPAAPTPEPTPAAPAPADAG